MYGQIQADINSRRSSRNIKIDNNTYTCTYKLNMGIKPTTINNLEESRNTQIYSY